MVVADRPILKNVVNCMKILAAIRIFDHPNLADKINANFLSVFEMELLCLELAD